MLRPLAEWLLELAATEWAPFALVAHSFLESFILPLAHEFFLIPVCLAHPRLSLFFAFLSTVASTLGNLVGYSIGKYGGRPVLQRLVPAKYMETAQKQLHRHDVWAVAIACFTPLPDKVFSIIAGSMHLNVKRFAVVVFLSRGTRFFMVAALIYFFGERAKEWILRYIDPIFVGMIAVSVLSALSWAYFVKRSTSEKEGFKKDPAA